MANNNPMNEWLQAQQAVLESTFDAWRRVARFPSVWRSASRVRRGCSPSEVVYEEGRMKVLHYLSPEPPKYETPLVLVYALVNRPYILDIMPNKSVVGHFVRGGFDTYLIDWGVPTHADRYQTMEAYINGYLMNVIDFVREQAESTQVNILGYCMGGTMSTMFTALHQELVKNLILMAAPIDFSTRDGLLNVWTDPNVLDVDAFVDTFGNCPADFLQSAFTLMKPVGNIVERPIGLWERIDNESFVEEYFTMTTWLNDNIPIPGEVFREFVKHLYQRNRLVKNQMQVGRHVVDLRQITCPVLNLMATADDLVPMAQSEPFNNLVGSKDRTTLKLKAGHIGLAMGTRAQTEMWPKAVAWLAERS
jgi:polyhydroxyalkanoate synthase